MFQDKGGVCTAGRPGLEFASGGSGTKACQVYQCERVFFVLGLNSVCCAHLEEGLAMHRFDGVDMYVCMYACMYVYM